MVSAVKDLFDFFIPRLCCVCNSKLKSEEEYVCSSCLIKFEIAPGERIEREFKRKFDQISDINDFLSLYIFEKDEAIQDLIHSIKYRRKFMAGFYFGRLAAMQFAQHIASWNISAVIPVPLHPVKNADRGYNQSYYIAKGLCSKLKADLSPSVLKRIKYTDTQTTMTISERELNIRGAFRCKKSIPSGNYLLVDDVITTGSTIKECARLLKGKGAQHVYAISLAIAE